MGANETTHAISTQESEELFARAGIAFRPRTPISHREFFAGRWEHLTTVCDSVTQTGLHIVIFGERGVGKTSLANVISPLLLFMEEKAITKGLLPRLVVKVNANSDDTFATIWKRSLDEVILIDNTPRIGFDSTNIRDPIPLREACKIGDVPSIDDVQGPRQTQAFSVHFR